MTLTEIESRVQAIRDMACDFERAHSLEDKLWADVLEAISNEECECPKAEAAAMALTTRQIEFERWCA